MCKELSKLNSHFAFEMGSVSVMMFQFVAASERQFAVLHVKLVFSVLCTLKTFL
jgi:hypothetical protein